MKTTNRRDFLRTTAGLGAAALAVGPRARVFAPPRQTGGDMALGLVTYLWGQDWDLPTVIANCEKSKVLGVELRTTHRHGVERDLNADQRKEVKKRFDDSPVVFVGPGSNERFDHPDAAALEQAIEATKAFVKLSHDCGGSGVKVKPNSFHKGVDRQKTIEQIGKALNVVGAFGADYGQQIRLEVHGQCAELPIMKQIMDVADHPNVGVCWNSNAQDLKGEGLEHNFRLVCKRFGATAHVRPLDTPGYPWQTLIELLVKIDYAGWVLLECANKPKDRVAAMAQQRELFEKMVARAQGQ